MLFSRIGHEVACTAVMHRDPYPHCVFPPGSILDVDDVADLLAGFPDDLMAAPSRRTSGGDKNYKVAHLNVFDRGRWITQPQQLSEPWQALVYYLAGSEYATMIRSVLGLGTLSFDVEIRVSRYPRGGWMSRHTDRPDKVFSHNIYLCPGWDVRWGGGLALYDQADASFAVKSFVPGPGNSVAFRRSDRSWHEVMPVSEDADRARCAVLVHGYHVSADIAPHIADDREAPE